METFELLKQLTEAPGPTGNEGAPRPSSSHSGGNSSTRSLSTGSVAC